MTDSTGTPSNVKMSSTLSLKPIMSPNESCTGCGGNPAVYHPRRREYQCPRCARSWALTEAAYEHLTDLLTDVMRAWVLHWHQADASDQDLQDLVDAVDMSLRDLGNQSDAQHREFIQAVIEGTAS